MRPTQNGVTLIELLTVIVVLGILASIAVPSYRNYLLRAQRTEATTALLNLQAAHHVSLEGDAYAVVPLTSPLPREEAELRVVLASWEGNRLTRRAQAVAEVVTALLSSSPQPKR